VSRSLKDWERQKQKRMGSRAIVSSTDATSSLIRACCARHSVPTHSGGQVTTRGGELFAKESGSTSRWLKADFWPCAEEDAR
jgi:hypothetical protein